VAEWGHRQFLACHIGQIAKRALDIVGAAIFLIICAPVAIALALHIRSDGGPALYRHERIGLRGRSFGCIKFRSMQVDADRRLTELLSRDSAAAVEWRETQKLRNDPRITRVGRFIRATSLDELPQLLNVLRGEMSLVGPRPIVQAELSLYGQHADTYQSVKPGLTGLWQISGRSNLSYHDRVRLDMQYVQNRTFGLDIMILLRTIPAVLRGRGAV
jgi:undecaprenyl-phosphate galactose phosphotransferase